MSSEEGVAEGAGLTQRPTTLQWGGPNGVCTNMGSPGPLGSLTPSPATRSKIEQLKQWSLSTYKCTRQILAEKMGKVQYYAMLCSPLCKVLIRPSASRNKGRYCISEPDFTGEHERTFKKSSLLFTLPGFLLFLVVAINEQELATPRRLVKMR